MITKNSRWYFLIAVFLLLSFTLSEAGEVKVTTYYPAPYGEYKKLKLPKTADANTGVIDIDTSRFLHNFGSNNTFLGTDAGNMTLTSEGSCNVGIGYQTLNAVTKGYGNTAAGFKALCVDTEGVFNTAIGEVALSKNTTGNGNVAIGTNALLSNTTGMFNTVVGYRAGETNVIGKNNVFLGYQAGYNEKGDNKLYIANSWSETPLIYGDFSTNRVGIATKSPQAALDITSDGGAILVPRKSTTGDPATPTPANGMIYYNTVDNKFRVYEDGAWKNLVGTGGPKFFYPPKLVYDGGVISAGGGWNLYDCKTNGIPATAKSVILQGWLYGWADGTSRGSMCQILDQSNPSLTLAFIQVGFGVSPLPPPGTVFYVDAFQQGVFPLTYRASDGKLYFMYSHKISNFQGYSTELISSHLTLYVVGYYE
ncbi:MAG: hypothetical protein NTV07_02800 [Candidatus Omnitrophica bacterium]|nr:hypothetical protein [Candidatus Omnitrophota bacterium]